MVNLKGETSCDGAPLVTVVVMCYNHARFLTECLNSVLRQSYPHIQLIITDDCSQDGSPAMIDSWIQANHINCHFIKHKVNAGVCRTANEALAIARGKYIASVSTDDVWFDDKIEKQVAIMEKQPLRVGILYSDALIIGEDGHLIDKSFIAAHRTFSNIPEGNLNTVLWQGNFIPAMATLIRRDCYSVVGLLDEDLYFEDWDFWLRVSRHFDFCYSPTASARYRIVTNSMAHGNTDKMLFAGLQICRKHIENGWISQEAMPYLADKLYYYVEQSYKRRLPGLNDAMALALKHDRKFRSRLLSCSIKLGIPYTLFSKIRHAVKRRLQDNEL
jgi:glycosyltransferase involved in cell wall biosynthesis